MCSFLNIRNHALGLPTVLCMYHIYLVHIYCLIITHNNNLKVSMSFCKKKGWGTGACSLLILLLKPSILFFKVDFKMWAAETRFIYCIPNSIAEMLVPRGSGKPQSPTLCNTIVPCTEIHNELLILPWPQARLLTKVVLSLPYFQFVLSCRALKPFF